MNEVSKNWIDGFMLQMHVLNILNRLVLGEQRQRQICGKPMLGILWQ